MAVGARNPYLVLGVDPAADQRAIESAYRRLCRRHHPDVCRDPDAGQRMREINAAYQVLRDSARRRAYDRQRAPSQPSNIQWQAARRAWREAARPPPPPAPPPAPPAARVRTLPGVLDFGFVRAGEAPTRPLVVRGPLGEAVEARVFTRGDWLRVDRTEVRGRDVVLHVTADPRDLSAFWEAAGGESAKIEGWLEFVDRHGSTRVPVSAILRREAHGWWDAFVRRAG